MLETVDDRGEQQRDARFGDVDSIRIERGEGTISGRGEAAADGGSLPFSAHSLRYRALLHLARRQIHGGCISALRLPFCLLADALVLGPSRALTHRRAVVHRPTAAAPKASVGLGAMATLTAADGCAVRYGGCGNGDGVVSSFAGGGCLIIRCGCRHNVLSVAVDEVCDCAIDRHVVDAELRMLLVDVHSAEGTARECEFERRSAERVPTARRLHRILKELEGDGACQVGLGTRHIDRGPLRRLPRASSSMQVARTPPPRGCHRRRESNDESTPAHDDRATPRGAGGVAAACEHLDRGRTRRLKRD